MVTATSPGTIEPGVLYTLDEAQQRMRWGRHALREARKRGLKTVKCGTRIYVLGSDIIKHIVAIRDGSI